MDAMGLGEFEDDGPRPAILPEEQPERSETDRRGSESDQTGDLVALARQGCALYPMPSLEQVAE